MPAERKIYPKWDVQVAGGKVVFKNRKMFDEHLVPLEGKKKLKLVIKPERSSRSRQEEKFYHAVVVRMVAGEMDITDQEAHEMLKSMHLREETQAPNGIRYERTKSTTELNDEEYRNYWKKCIMWAALPTKDDGLGPDSGLGLYIPQPNEVDYQEGIDY